MSINYLVAGNTLNSNVVGIDKRKIKHIKIVPSKLELSLVEWPEHKENRFTIDLYLKEFNDNIFSIVSYSNLSRAKKEYEKILNKIKKGNYELHVYNNGKVELKY